MTTVNTDIQHALNKHLASLATGTAMLPVAWENIEYTPVMGIPYLRAWLMPGETFTVTLGPNSFDRFVGVFQIDCLYPMKKGWSPAKVKAGEVCTHFKKGTLITYNSIEVTMLKAYPMGGVVDGDWYRVSVSTVYYCYDNS